MIESSPSDQTSDEEVSLEELIRSVEESADPIHEHSVSSAVRAWAKDNEATKEAAWEDMAFRFHAHDHQEPSVWNLYFGPMMSGTTEDGERWDAPSLGEVSLEAIQYWSKRARETPHPVLTARYADLCWELPKRIADAQPDFEMAQVAVDAYLRGVANRRYLHSTALTGKLKRALDIALQISDDVRLIAARDALIQLELELAEDDALGLWGFAFDALVEPPNRRIPVATAQEEKLVSELEARLDRFGRADPTKYHPSGAEAAALRLAAYYRRSGRTAEVERVMGVYTSAVRKMKGVAAPMVYAHCLEGLHEHLVRFGLSAGARDLTGEIEEAGRLSTDDMEEISAEVEIPSEKVDAFFEGLLAGSDTEVLTRLAVHFLPRQDDLEAQLLKLSREAPLSFLFSTAVLDEEGRTVARVGPLKDDLEGHLVRQTSQALSFAIPWLREALEQGQRAGLVSLASISAFTAESPLFQSPHRPILLAGLEAYSRGDYMGAMHILIPQIEQAVRRLAGLIGTATITARRGGGFHARVLDDLLRDPALAEPLGEDILAYFRVLLTDARGWNLRNMVCHGLSPVNTFSAPVADRVLHAVLVLSLVREREPGDEDTNDPGEAQAR